MAKLPIIRRLFNIEHIRLILENLENNDKTIIFSNIINIMTNEIYWCREYNGDTQEIRFHVVIVKIRLWKIRLWKIRDEKIDSSKIEIIKILEILRIIDIKYEFSTLKTIIPYITRFIIKGLLLEKFPELSWNVR